MFGREAAKELNYVECFPGGYRKGTIMAKECIDARLEGFPTWVINGQVTNPFHIFLNSHCCIYTKQRKTLSVGLSRLLRFTNFSHSLALVAGFEWRKRFVRACKGIWV